MRNERLKHVADVRVSNVDKKTTEGDAQVRLCNYTDVYYNEHIVGDFAFMVATATQDQRTTFGLRQGDVVLTKDSETADDIGVTALVTDDVPDLVCGYHLAIVRADTSRVVGGYLRWVLASQPARQRMSAAATGVTRFGLRSEVIADLPIPVPSLPVQRAIADYLDRETARIDALIVAKRQMVQRLEERWRSVVETSMSTLIAEHGAIPLRYLVSCLDGRRVPVSSEERAGRRGPYPYYGASGIVDWIDDWLFDEELVLLGEDGAQLGDPSYPIAQLVRGKIWVNNHAHVLRPIAADPEFLSLHLNTFDRIAFMSGGTREKITQDDMNRIPFPHVSISIQREVARRLSRIRGKSDTIVSVLTRQTDLLQEHRQALITAAVMGQLDTPEAA